MLGLHEENVEKIKNAPRPGTKKQVRSFVGLAGYYRDFIPNFAAIAAPLSDLTRKGQPTRVEWGQAQEKAYQTIKFHLTNEPILRLPDPVKTYYLQTDASNTGIGAVLMQKHDEKLFPVWPMFLAQFGLCFCKVIHSELKPLKAQRTLEQIT